MHLFFSRLFAPRARAPEGEIIYAIGDIHGRDDLLGRLHDAIGRDLTAAAGARKATVVYLGDYVDRGPSSRAVLDRLIAQPVAAAESVFLKGNHEDRSEEHTSELQSLMRISYAVFCLKTKKKHNTIK